jgi:hypothetical protein
MNRWSVNLAAALGLTTIFLAQLIEPLVRPSHDLVYHWSGRPLALFGPTLVDVLILFLLLAGLLCSAQYGRVWRSTVWAALLLSLPWIIFHQIERIRPGAVPHWFRLPPFFLVFIACPLLVALWSRRAQEQRERVIESATMVLAVMALSGALVISQLLWFWWKARGLNRPLPLHQATEVATTNGAKRPPRILWILLDELSYQQVYQRRYSDLQLPAFDALAADSTVFTDVVPTANYTEIAIPSLLSGQMIGANRSTADGLLMVRSPEGGAWRRFDGRETVFQDALNAGYSTAVAGWYNPYCRILDDVLDRCYWTDDYMEKNGLVADGTFKSNLASSADTILQAPTLRRVLQWTLHVPATIEHQKDGAHLRDYRDLARAGDEVLLDSSARFVFLHLPIPHPNGIYDRRTQRLTAENTTYIDNLALADRYLAHVRKLLESSGQWDSSAVLVMGDHSWRTSLVWERFPEWTPEEQKASLGQFDERPAYIVKLPGQTSGARIDTPFRAIETRALVDGLLAGTIGSAEELKAWAQSQKPSRGKDVALLP